MKTDFLIVGGGVAGLAALNRLTDRGAEAVLLEERSFPAHKICGEFISPEALPLLQRWNIEPSATMSSIHLVSKTAGLAIQLKEKAGAISRYILDDSLAQRAAKGGAKLITGAKVSFIEVPENISQPYRVALSSGELFETKALIVSTGRLPGAYTVHSKPVFCYVGAKAHFEGIDGHDQLSMYLMPGAYFGVAPVAPGVVNVAGLIACSHEQALTPLETFRSFLEEGRASPLKSALESGKLLFKEWMVGSVPKFGLRPAASWNNAYFVGDAKGVIPPAAGGGLSMALSSGILAADCALSKDADLYNRSWGELYQRRIQKGELLHRLFLNQNLLRFSMPLVRMIPGSAKALYSMTRS